MISFNDHLNLQIKRGNDAKYIFISGEDRPLRKKIMIQTDEGNSRHDVHIQGIDDKI